MLGVPGLLSRERKHRDSMLHTHTDGTIDRLCHNMAPDHPSLTPT